MTIQNQISKITDIEELKEVLAFANTQYQNLIKTRKKKIRYWNSEQELIEHLKILHSLKEKKFREFLKIKSMPFAQWASLSSMYDNRVVKKNKYGIR